MRSIIIYTSIALFTLISTACTDLAEDPKGILAPESFFKSAADVDAAIYGAYAEWVTVALTRDLPLTLMLRSDMVDIGDRNTEGSRIGINDFAMDASNNLTRDIWQYFFRAISAANTVIKGARLIRDDQTVKDRLEAEGRFIRAYSYFHLVRLYGAVPYLDAPVETAAELDAAVRTSESEIYSRIIEDLVFAKDHLPDQREPSVRNKATAGTAATVLADVYLTLEEFDRAADEARFVINNINRFDYRLETNYQDLFNADLAGTIKESILTIDFENSFASNANYNTDWLVPLTRIRDSAPRSLSVAVPSLAVYQSWDDRDHRKDVSFEDSVVLNGVKQALVNSSVTAPRPHIAKYFRYPGPQDAGDDRRSDSDYHLYRYAEVLLIAAESIAESEGVTPEAIGYIDQIRERARFNGETITTYPEDVDPAIATTDFIDLVREERRLELCFEFKRWYDIKRWGILEETFSGPGVYEPHIVDVTRDYLFPIPQREINVTSLSQNSGY